MRLAYNILKGSVSEKLKGVYANVESNSIVIATKSTPTVASIRRKGLKTTNTEECRTEE